MGRNTHTFSLTDRDGADHQYRCTEHPTDEGFDLQLELAEILATVPSVVLALLEALEGAKPPDDDDDDSSPQPSDPLAVSKALRELPRAIIRAGGSKLVIKILKHTERQEGAEGTTFVKLNATIARDNAYAGNYRELYRALWEVMKANFDPFSLVNTDALKGAWNAVQSWLPEEEEEEQPTS
jgi:hypothetical protein